MSYSLFAVRNYSIYPYILVFCRHPCVWVCLRCGDWQAGEDSISDGYPAQVVLQPSLAAVMDGPVTGAVTCAVSGEVH